MSSFTVIVFLGVLMIIGGISLMETPLLTFLGAGSLIIILFFISGIFGIIRGVREKRYDKDFGFAVLSVILGIVGCVVPGAAAMSNYVMLYLAAVWFMIHGVLSIVSAIGIRKQGGGFIAMVLGIAFGVLELVLGIYSLSFPAMLAASFGILIGFYYIESGVNVIITGAITNKGGNNMTILFTIIGILSVLGGIAMLATPLITFLGAGYCIIMLLFFSGVLGIARGITTKRYDKGFYLAILALVMGIIGFAVPGIGAMNSFMLLYMAAAWFIIHGILFLMEANERRKQGGGTGVVVLGFVLGALELILGIYSLAHPALLALSLGILIGFYFIESGVGMVFIGSDISRLVAIGREAAHPADNS